MDIREYSSPKGLAIRTVNSHMVQAPRASCSNGANAFIEYMNCCAYVGVFSLPHCFSSCYWYLLVTLDKGHFLL